MATFKKAETNKLGVKNPLINDINAGKEKRVSWTMAAETVSNKSCKKMKNEWGDKMK